MNIQNQINEGISFFQSYGISYENARKFTINQKLGDYFIRGIVINEAQWRRK
jgi:hypothetical protein